MIKRQRSMIPSNHKTARQNWQFRLMCILIVYRTDPVLSGLLVFVMAFNN